MLITIKTLAGRKIILDYDPTQKIIEIKKTLQEKEGIDHKQIRLIFAGKVINDDKTIEESNITEGSQLMMALNLRG